MCRDQTCRFILNPKRFSTLSPQRAVPAGTSYRPEESRQIFAEFGEVFGVGPELPVVTDCLCGNVHARRYVPAIEKPLPAIVYFHGGGWVLGNLETHDAVCRRLAKESNCVVIAVDYRLAPEHPFPAALDDGYAATKYVTEHPDEFGVQSEKIVVAGDSAGGNLAAAVSQRFRDEELSGIEMQLLLYPVIEPNFDADTYEEFAEGFGLTRSVMKFFWQQYVPQKSDHAESVCGSVGSSLESATQDVRHHSGI